MSTATTRPPKLPPPWFIHTFWRVHRALYRLSRGRFLWTTSSKRGWGALRLTTIGRKSGRERSVIVGYIEDGPNLKPAYTVTGGPVPDQRSLDLPGYPGGHDIVGNHVNAQFQLDVLGDIGAGQQWFWQPFANVVFAAPRQGSHLVERLPRDDPDQVRPRITHLRLVDVGPPQRHQLADPEPMAEGNEDHRGVAMPPAPPLTRCLHQSIDLGLGEILAWPDLGILLPLRRRVPPYNCSDFSVSGGIAHVRQHRRKPTVSIAHCTVFGFFRNCFRSRRRDRHSGVQRLHMMETASTTARTRRR